MRFYTKTECEQWLRDRQRGKPDEASGHHVERVLYPKQPYKYFFLAHWAAHNLTFRRPALLWITEWGIWSSSENWHLYYRLRHSYTNQQLLHEAPGHLFLEHEAEDLASFLHLAMLNGWGGYVLTQADYVNAFFRHDEFVDFYAAAEQNLDCVREALIPNRLRVYSKAPEGLKH